MIGMLGILMQRIENSALENETFVEYFQSYIKIWNDHSNSIEKNAQMFLKPLRMEHEKQGSKFKEFMHQVETMDMIYAQNQRAFSKKVQQLVNHNLMRITVSMRALVTQIHGDYVVKTNTYRDCIKITGYLFDQYMKLFEKVEEMGYSNSSGSLDEDSFLCE